MRKRNLLLLAAVLLACWCTPGLADEGGAVVEGTAAFGTHLTDPGDHTGRAGEYANQNDLEEFVADLYMDLFGSTKSTLFNVHFLHQDSATKSFDFGVKTDKYVSAEVGYDSFIHNLDKDHLANMQGKAGGKQVYHTDNDPLGKYWLEYSEFNAGVEIDLPFVPNGKVYGSYRDQHKTGYTQEMTIDHCAFCHVESNVKRVDQQTETWRAGLSGSQGPVSLNYELTESKYRDNSGSLSRDWFQPMHPVYGTSGAEFASRMLFPDYSTGLDVTQPYARSTNNDKTTHNVSVKVKLPQGQMVKAAYTNANRRSWWTGVENQFDAYALGAAHRWNRNQRTTLKLLAYETKVDDRFVNLPAYRDGMGFGGQNFDWTRISSANRKVLQADANHSWRIGKRHFLKGSARGRIIDRDAMAQSQTTYVFEEDGTAHLVASTPYENKTRSLKLKGRYDYRFHRKGSFNAGVEAKFIGKPFMNPTAMCEESVQGVHSVHTGGAAEDRLYYFQRQRYGMGSNQPSESWRLNGKASYQLHPRASVNGFVTVAMEKNDDLNLYQYDRDVITPGLNFWTAPTDRLLLTLGWSWNKVKSDAVLCPPIFDG